MWSVIQTQNEEALLDDYYHQVISSAAPSLPPHDQVFGSIEAHWYEPTSGLAYIATSGGSPEDRILIDRVVWAQLEPHGYKRAVPKLEAPPVGTEHRADYNEVVNNAKQLVQENAVQILRNSPTVTVGKVASQHKPGVEYDTEIARADPGSPKETGSSCTCDWGKFQNTPRTRQWQKYQDRECKHIIATRWVASAMPFDEARAPGNQGDQGQMSLFDQSGGQAPPTMPLMQQPTFPASPQFNAPGEEPFQLPLGGPQMGAPGPSGGAGGQPPMPPPQDVLPQFQGQPAPPVNPASVPGQKQPDATNPIQYPGAATFSSWHPGTMLRMARTGAIPTFNEGDRVQLKADDIGTWVGRSEAHGAGQPASIPKNSIGEVLSVHPSTGMPYVYYTGPARQNREMEPHGIVNYHWPSDLILRNDIPPGPSVKNAVPRR